MNKRINWFTSSIVFVVIGALGLLTAEILHILHITSWPNIVGAGVAITMRAFILVGSVQIRGRGKDGFYLATTAMLVMLLSSAIYIHIIFKGNDALQVIMQTGNIGLLLIELFAGKLSIEDPLLSQYRNRFNFAATIQSQLRHELKQLRDKDKRDRNSLAQLQTELSQAREDNKRIRDKQLKAATLCDELQNKLDQATGKIPTDKFLIRNGKRTIYIDVPLLYSSERSDAVEVSSTMEQMERRLTRNKIDFSNAIVI